MNPEQLNKTQLESLQSISIDPNLREVGSSTIFGGRKSSFDYVNILKDSDPLAKKDYRNSLDILASNINNDKTQSSARRSIIQVYNDENKVKIEQQGFQPLQIGQVYSESEDEEKIIVKKQSKKVQCNPWQEEQRPLKLQTVFNDVHFSYHSFFPKDLATVLRERQIPLQYVRGLLMAKTLKQIKSTRRLKVQRYLQKRRKKTWNRKICYNCRQKVAEQRLRIKGKFIKKRRALEILGLKQPISMAVLKQKLYAALKNKNSQQLEDLIKNQQKIDIQSQNIENSVIQEQQNEQDSKPIIQQPQEKIQKKEQQRKQ